MNIIIATKKAIEKGVGITNIGTKKSGVYLLPTNTAECYIVIPVGVKYPNTSLNICPRWNPKASDIICRRLGTNGKITLRIPILWYLLLY